MDALNLREVTKIFSSLIVSPIVGLVIAGGLIFLLRRYWSGTKKRDRIHRIPEDRKKKTGKRKPPFWTRIALIVSAAGVAFSHGANDGQKGIGLVVGLVIAGGLIFLLRRYWSGTKKRDRIHRIPEDRKKKTGKRKPPFWTRIALIVSAAGVAFSHGANDGQKGIGLVMLVLVGIAPAGFVVNMNASGYEITRTRDAVTNFEHYLQQHPELPQKLIAMEPPLPAASTDGTQVTEFHCHPANTFDAIARVKTQSFTVIRQIPLMRLRALKRCCQAIWKVTSR